MIPQQINFVPRAPNVTLHPFLTTINRAPAINEPLHPSSPSSPNTQQQKCEHTKPNALPIPNPLFAPNFTAPNSHAPLINQPPFHNTFNNNNNPVHKVVRSVTAPVSNMPNIPFGRE